MRDPQPINPADRPRLEALLDAFDRLYDGSCQASEVRSLLERALVAMPGSSVAPAIDAAVASLGSIIAGNLDPAAQAEQALAAVDPLRRLLAAGL